VFFAWLRVGVAQLAQDPMALTDRTGDDSPARPRDHRGVTGDRPPNHVVIVGAGFAGLATARELANKPLDVTLVDTHNFHTFQPLLYQVATAGLDPADVAFPIRAIFANAPNVTVRRGRVERVDPEDRTVRLADGSSLDYDGLVVATGATTSYFSVPGAAERTLPLYTLRDARRLRNSLLGLLESVDAHPERFSDGAPSIVVIGGGATGVEIAGAVVELLDISIRHDRLRLDRTRTRVLLVDASDRLLSAFDGRASGYAAEELTSRGIELRLATTVSSVDEHGVVLGDGSSVRADLVIWAGGVTVRGTLAATLPGERGPGARVVVGADLSLPDHPEVFVVGDAAALPLGPGRDGYAPQLAQAAMQSGRQAARELLARFGDTAPPRFSYLDKGVMATIGRRAAVAQLETPRALRGIVVKGTLGWFSWLGLHLVYLIGARNRAVVLLNWLWRYVGWTSGPRIILENDDPSS